MVYCVALGFISFIGKRILLQPGEKRCDTAYVLLTTLSD